MWDCGIIDHDIFVGRVVKILICYASTEGQTRKICRFCADQIFALGHSVEMLGVSDAGDLELAGFDAAVLAGSVHTGKVQRELAEFAGAHAGALNRMATLFLQVSLAAAGDDEHEHADLRRIADEFCGGAGWTPDATHHIAGAFRFTQYDFFRSWAMRYISARKDRQVDPHADTEFTDWSALSGIMRDWTASLSARQRP